MTQDLDAVIANLRRQREDLERDKEFARLRSASTAEIALKIEKLTRRIDALAKERAEGKR